MSFLTKTFSFLRIGFIDALSWRLNYFLQAIFNFLGTAALIGFWTAYYNSGGGVAGYSLDEMIIYYTSATIIGTTFTSGFVFDLSRFIHNGELSMYLIKPVSFFRFNFCTNIGDRLAILLLYAFPICIIGYVLRAILPQSTTQWLLIISVLCGGFILQYLSGLVFGLLSVWFKSHYQAPMIYASLTIILGGRLIPLDLLPQWLETLARNSPFPYLFSIPIDLLMQKRFALTIHELGIFTVWLITLLIIGSVLWKYAAQKYEASGN